MTGKRIQIGILHSITLFQLFNSFSWVYGRFFVADGNFKADHIRQKNNETDIWLSEGGGMMPRRDDYEGFLKTAIERRTASIFFIINFLLLMQLTESTM